MSHIGNNCVCRRRRPRSAPGADGRQRRVRLSLVTALPGMVDSLRQRRTMAVACCAHALHDGYTDVLYVLLPLWQTEFTLDYAEIGILRALYVGAMAGFQVPAGAIAERLGGPAALGPRHRARRARPSDRRGEPRFLDADRGARHRRDGIERTAPDRGEPCRPKPSPARGRARRCRATISPATSARWRSPPRPPGRSPSCRGAGDDGGHRRRRSRRRRRDPPVRGLPGRGAPVVKEETDA